MPQVFLSPSTQEYNPYNGGGNEEYYMNVIIDAMLPYLESSGISYGRNDTSGTFLDSVRRSNSGSYELHLALHSNAAAGDNAGRVRGSQVYYYPGSKEGMRAADIFANGLKEIYPLPDRVQTIPTTALGEIVKTKAPAILIELAYHDNPEDADWIRDNIGLIAENLALSLADFLGVEIIMPDGSRNGVVSTDGGNLNIRTEPTTNSAVKGRIPDGTVIPLLSSVEKWYLTQYGGIRGYVSSDYVRVV
ncbi:MAG: N-acetylmuramoyl-L-alanine amidase [Clostridia bacterium]|nr:N-acetylmuramoyl-L-alanine amidase [Clostridia bacterium]